MKIFRIIKRTSLLYNHFSIEQKNIAYGLGLICSDMYYKTCYGFILISWSVCHGQSFHPTLLLADKAGAYPSEQPRPQILD